jgi:hypothetical protein
VFYSTFVYYSNGGNDPYHMSLNAFTTLLDDAGIPDPDSLSIKRSDCDTIFIVCNFQPDKSSPDVAVNDEHAMMRFEFMECIVRLGEPQQPAAMVPGSTQVYRPWPSSALVSGLGAGSTAYLCCF